MADYIKSTNFTAKDSLPTGNTSKLVRGSDFDTEFDELATRSAEKANKIPSSTLNSLVMQKAGGDIEDSGITTDGSGTITNLTGDLTGDVTGNVTGDVTGNLTGNVKDSNGVDVIIAAGDTTPVNELTVTNADTLVDVGISATGDDTDISINVVPKGDGVLKLATVGLNYPGESYGGMVLLNETVISGTPSTIDFQSLISSTYSSYEIELRNVLLTQDNKSISIKFSQDNGSTWDETSTHYDQILTQATGGAVSATVSTTLTSIQLCTAIVSFTALYSGVSGRVRITDPLDTSTGCSLLSNIGGSDTLEKPFHANCVGLRTSAAAIDAIRILNSGTTFASGTIRFWGIV